MTVLSPEDVEAVALRVVALLRAEGLAPDAGALLWSTADVARELGMSADWVREHRHDLGVLPSAGPRPRLLFDPSSVRAWATARDEVVRSSVQSVSAHHVHARGRGLRAGSGTDLLPIRGDRAA